MQISQLISVSPGFQRAINVVYDLNNRDKMSGYIPTERSEGVLRHIFRAMAGRSNDGATMLVGTYGTGKSHLATVVGSLYSKILDSQAFFPIIEKIKDANVSTDFQQELLVDMPFLVVPISCSPGEDLARSVLNGLRRSLADANLNVHLQTDYSLALRIIEEWEEKYPETYVHLGSCLKTEEFKTADELRIALESLNETALSTFKSLYPALTSGASFDGYSGPLHDVLEGLCIALKPLGYRGLLLIIDEFNKVLDAAGKVAISLKALQDIAELASRPDKGYIVHLLTMSHRTIGQYSSQFGKLAAEQWQQVEGRFSSIDVSNRPWEVFELIAKVLKKRPGAVEQIVNANSALGEVLRHRRLTTIFDSLTTEQIEDLIVQGCFPIHPIATFALPRVSAKLAQNERTLFTFLSGKDDSPLPDVLKQPVQQARLVMPWQIYDYFAYQFERTQDLELKRIWQHITSMLDMLPLDSESDHERALIKTIGVFWAVNNPRNLPVTEELISYALRPKLTHDQISHAFLRLRERKMLYVRKADEVVCLVEPIAEDVDELVEQWRQKAGIRYPLNMIGDLISPHYVIAHRYNLRNKMSRFLTPLYCDLDNLHQVVSQGMLNADYVGCDGVLCYLFPRTAKEVDALEALARTCHDPRVVFALPKKPVSVSETALRVKALQELQAEVIIKDKRASVIWQLYLEDARSDLIKRVGYVTGTPANVRYYHSGTIWEGVTSESLLSSKLSDVFSTLYCCSPRINNELVNKHRPTLTSRKARNTAIDLVLRASRDPYKSCPSSQEVFMYQSLFEETGIVDKQSYRTVECYPNPLESLVGHIVARLKGAKNSTLPFDDLLKELLAPPYGVRKGIIPVVMAATLSRVKQNLSVTKAKAECQIEAELLDKMVTEPSAYELILTDWNVHHEELAQGLSRIFNHPLSDNGILANRFMEIGEVIFRWFASLPRYARETREVSNTATDFRRQLRQLTRNPKTVLTALVPRSMGLKLQAPEEVKIYLETVGAVKQELETCLDALTKRVGSKLAAYLSRHGTDGASVVSLARTMVEQASPAMLQDSRWVAIQSFIKRFQGYDDASFVHGVAQTITGIRLEDWLDGTLEGLERTLEDLQDMQAEVATTCLNGPRLEICFYGGGGQANARAVLQECEISTTGRLLESDLESAIEDFGDSISIVERRQILMNLLKKMI